EARRIGGEGRKQGRGLVARREEQHREERREHRVQIEVVPLEDRPEGRGEDDPPFFGPEALDGVFRQKTACFGLSHDCPLSLLGSRNMTGGTYANLTRRAAP